MATSGNTVYVAGDDKSIYVSQDDEYSKVAFYQMNFYDQNETDLVLANAGDNCVDIYNKIKNDEDEYSSKRPFDYEFSQKINTPLLRTLNCWDISNNSQFLVISTSRETIFYEREKDKKTGKYSERTRLELTVTAMSMTTDSKLLAVQPNLEILRFSLYNPESKGELFFDFKRIGVCDCQIVQFQVSSCVSKIAFLTSNRKFFMTNIQDVDLREFEITYPIHVGLLFRSVFHVILTKVTDKSGDSTVENEYEFYEKAVQELKEREFKETHNNLVRSAKFALTRTWLELGVKASLFYEDLSEQDEDDWDYVFRNTKLFLDAINLLRKNQTFKETALKDVLAISTLNAVKQDLEVVDFGGKQYTITYCIH
ncbi:hypothetical protein GCK72_005402 [Caenorhabditis remanei]|uniref:Uncharacterized protein n=1 Tax=Caenorhabditis remanei TaxID=31234 RepID=A0A6A5HCG0_CAERE|nr:hypothetical protein GCK72_005402 [Caenorhabditis remanei]KAF1765450.1 hypothetical protein GCK72_005402 [Caenorhabditis remanei]